MKRFHQPINYFDMLLKERNGLLITVIERESLMAQSEESKTYADNTQQYKQAVVEIDNLLVGLKDKKTDETDLGARINKAKEAFVNLKTTEEIQAIKGILDIPIKTLIEHAGKSSKELPKKLTFPRLGS